MTVYRCKCHKRPYTVCSRCGCQYCESTWPVCPRIDWHPSHGTCDADIAARYMAQQAAHVESERRLGIVTRQQDITTRIERLYPGVYFVAGIGWCGPQWQAAASTEATLRATA